MGAFPDRQTEAGLHTHGTFPSVHSVLNQPLCNFPLCHGGVLIKGGVGAVNILTSNRLNPLPPPSLGILISSFTPGSHSLHLTGNYIYDHACVCVCVWGGSRSAMCFSQSAVSNIMTIYLHLFQSHLYLTICNNAACLCSHGVSRQSSHLCV